MKLLGAVLAGGLSSRFGSDKALARINESSLIERAVETLEAQCDAVCVVGRELAPSPVVKDWPRAGLGPLGGVAGAMQYARNHGFAEILTVAVDIPDLPSDLANHLAPAPAFVRDQPVVGRWRTADLELLSKLFAGEGRYAMRRFADMCEARPVTLDRPLANINTEQDLHDYLETRSITAEGARE